MLTLAIAALAVLRGPEVARADALEHVVVPFACSIERGRLIVKPADPQFYRLTSARESRHYEVCDQGDPSTCRVVELARFEMTCGDGTVGWRDVAVHAIGLMGGGARLEAEKLQLQFRGRLRPWSAAPCLNGQWPHRGWPLAESGSAFPDVGCESTGTFDPLEPYLTLPDGFAPLADLGGRVLTEPAFVSLLAPPPPQRGQLKGARLAALASSAGHLMAVTAAIAEEPPVVQTVQTSTLDAAPVVVPVASVSQAWITLVEATRPLATAAKQDVDQAIIAALLGLALVSGLVSSMGWIVAHRARAPFRPADTYDVILRRDGVNLQRPDAQLCGELCRSAQTIVAQVHVTVDQLKGAAPLRRVLLREIRELERFLGTLIEQSPVDDAEWRRMRAKLQRVVNDMIRLKDIVDAAHSSLSVARADRGLPNDINEAYEALGANPTTSDKILKRLVDALRANWHPDLAADDDDRRVREERIKQINVAWDLVSGKRAET